MAAGLCKSQQCSIERRGFRQELDSWRHKLIHCVGFESILEGLFGPGLLEDISLYKDCEPEGVCDWSFDENCLFCCLRREKVKEHLADLNKPVTDVGPENLLKQEKLRIIRLEKQAEEFINAVFYKKDTPRVLDPSIPLVAREIMQRMIRQFAAEYTSKNSCTQDSSQPNSTNNQSLQTPSPGQTSPPPATTQNPVLSKLLMADQDSPLDLTVKRSLSEDACEQEDGVLDLSTKKSPHSGSTALSTSPSTSNAIGNGMSSTEKVRNPNSSASLTLEKFMVKLCTPHQKQFINVLNNICTEDSSNQENSTVISDQQNMELDSKEYAKTIFDPSLLHLNKLVCHTPSNAPTDLDIKNNATDCAGNQAFLDLVPEYLTATERLSPAGCSVTKCTLLNCSFLSTDHGEQTTEKKLVLCMKTSEKQYKIHNMICQTSFTERCFVPQKHLLKDLSNDTPGSEFGSVIPKISENENSLQSFPKSLLLHAAESDCNLKQDSSVNSSNVDNRFVNGDINSLKSCCPKSVSLPSSCKNGLQENIKPHTSIEKCKRTEKVSDDQNYIVSLNHPINEHRLENPSSALYTVTAEEYNTAPQLATNVGIPEALSEGFISLVCNKGWKDPIPLSDPSSKNKTETQLGPRAVDSACYNWKVTALGQAENCIGPVTISNLSPGDFGQEMIQYVNESVKSCTEIDLITPSLMCNAHKSIENVPITVIQNECSADVNSAYSQNIPVFNTNCAEIEEPQPTTEESVSLSCCSDIQGNILTPICCSNLENSGNLFQYVTFSVDGPGSEHSTDTVNISSFCKGDLAIPDIHVEKCSVLKNLGTLELLQKTIGCSAFPNIKGKQVFGHKRIHNSEMGIVESALINEREHFSSDFSGSLQIEREYSSEGNRIDYGNVLSTTKEELEDKCPEMLESFQVKLRCSTAANNLDESSMFISIKENIPSLLSSSAEHSVSGLEKETAIKEGQNCDITTLSNEQNKILNSLVTKSLSEEKTINTYNLKSENVFNDKISSMSLKKKSKNILAPSDRRLRSRHTQESVENYSVSGTISDTLQSPNLQIYVSTLPDTNNLERVVEVRSKTILKSTLNPKKNICEKTIDSSEKNDPELMLRNFPTTEMGVFSDNCLSNKMSLRCKQKKKVKICVNVNSKERRVYFPSENSLRSTDDGDIDLKVNTSMLTTTSYSFRTRKENKRRAKKLKHGSLALLNCSSAPISLENTNNQFNRKANKSQHTGQQSHDSLNAVSLNDKNIPNHKSKFVEWYSEEENQERIANFNTKFMSLHKRWIPLEKETPNVQKSKNKSDKLKEIWKTKKRLRKIRSTQESQQCSAMQMLFLSKLNLSDICKYFLETTETRSLVIVKKLNTCLPEDLPLPIIPLPKYPSFISYHHTLQAERLKKHLKKFASVFPARNNHKTKEAIVNLIRNEELQPSKTDFDGKGKCDTIQKPGLKREKSLVNLNNPVVAQGKKCNSVHGKLQLQSLSIPYAKSKPELNVKERNPNSKTSNRKGTYSKLSLEVTRDIPKLKTLSADKQRGQKRSKEHLIKSEAHLRKKLKTDLKASTENVSYSKHSLPANKVQKVKLDAGVSLQNKQIANKMDKPENECLKNKKATTKKGSSKVQLVGLTCSAKTNKIKSTKQKHFLSKRTRDTATSSQIKRTAEKMLTRSLSKRASGPPQQKRNQKSKLDPTKHIKRDSFQVK